MKKLEIIGIIDNIDENFISVSVINTSTWNLLGKEYWYKHIKRRVNAVGDRCSIKVGIFPLIIKNGITCKINDVKGYNCKIYCTVKKYKFKEPSGQLIEGWSLHTKKIEVKNY